MNTNVIEREKRSERRKEIITLTVRFDVIAIVRHQFHSELPSNLGEKRNIMNNIVSVIRKISSHHFLE